MFEKERETYNALVTEYKTFVADRFFEHLHPFHDGNGRIGRLLVNKLLLRAGQPMIIIEREQREEYINALKLFRKDTQEHLVIFFYKVLNNRMQKEIEEKRNATENFKAGWEGAIYS